MVDGMTQEELEFARNGRSHDLVALRRIAMNAQLQQPFTLSYALEAPANAGDPSERF